jgi:hypothetical protein
MKKLLLIPLLASVLGGTAGCEKNGDSMDASLADCSVFVSTTPGKETILLARSGLPYLDEYAKILAGFETEYGAEYIKYNNRDPYRPHPEAVPSCYELTMTVNIAESSHDLPAWFMAVKIDGDTRIYKFYEWTCSEKDAERFTPWLTELYKNYGGGGTIVDISIRNLGPEVKNMPIEF